jgi:hypothetical protein
MLDFEIYSPLQFTLLLGGLIGWVIAYALLIRNSFKFKFIEMPIICVAFNMAWELYLGSFAYPPEKIGYFLSYGYRYAIIIDIGIVGAVALYARNQIELPFVKKYFITLFLSGLVVCFMLNYFFIQAGFDTKEGSVSGFLINLMISTIYISNYYKSDKKEYYSLTLAISRGLGTLSFATFNTITYLDSIPFLAAIGAVVAVLDIAFVVYVLKDRKQNNRIALTI